MAKDICSVDGCEKIAATAALCPMHYQRKRIHGDVGPAQMSRVSHRGQICAVDGCGQPRRKREWCASHYSMFGRLGVVEPFGRKWPQRVDCVVCGEPSIRARRRFCSSACSYLWNIYDGKVPTSGCSTRCGATVPFEVKRKEGSRRAMEQKLLCDDCRASRWVKRLKIPPFLIADRDGTACGICHTPVDMTLHWPNRMSPSVDHIVAVAHGGTDESANLQLAHLTCNTAKGARKQPER